MDIIEEIRFAIKNKKVIQFVYDGLLRISEPHVLGIKNNIPELLIFQIGGSSSSGGLPNWRRIKVRKISNFVVMNDYFAGRRDTISGQHSDFDTIIEIVS